MEHLCRWYARMWWYNLSRSDRTQSTATVIPGAPFSVVFTWLAMFLPASLGPKANHNQCCVYNWQRAHLKLHQKSFGSRANLLCVGVGVGSSSCSLNFFTSSVVPPLDLISKWAIGVTTHTETYLRQTRRLIAKQWLQIANKQQQQSVNSIRFSLCINIALSVCML